MILGSKINTSFGDLEIASPNSKKEFVFWAMRFLTAYYCGQYSLNFKNPPHSPFCQATLYTHLLNLKSLKQLDNLQTYYGRYQVHF